MVQAMAWRSRRSLKGGLLALSMRKKGRYGRPGEALGSRPRSSSGMRCGGTVWIQLKRPVCRSMEDDAIDVRPARAEILVPALEGDVVVLHPLDESVRSGPDREELGILFLECLLVHDLRGLREHRQQRPERLRQMKAHLVLA